MVRKTFVVTLLVLSAVVAYNWAALLLQQPHVARRGSSEEGARGRQANQSPEAEGASPASSEGKPEPQAEQAGGGSKHPVVKRPEGRAPPKRLRMFHTAVTANDSPYSKWQCTVMYYWFRKRRDEGGALNEMGGFTRVLHSGAPDNLMAEIPTFVVDPLPTGMDKGYIVLNRPFAFVQWLQKAKIEEEYILMAEPDHVLVKPLPNLATEFMPAAYAFFYIKPEDNEALLRRWYPKERGPINNIDPIGNSPVIIKKTELMEIAPLWHNVSLQMKNDPVVDKEFGWVLEMYGYATAAAMKGVSHILWRDFMVQPPWDTKIGDAFIIHFTYGCDYTLKGVHMPGKFGEWRFDKRTYSEKYPPKNLTLPPKGVPETVVQLIESINEAAANSRIWA